MTAGRLYCIQSWNNASAYSGEQIGSRLAQSRAIHFNRDGTANLDLYREEEPAARKAKPKKKASDSIDLANSHLERMEKLGQDLDEEYLNGEIDKERYDYLRYKIDLRLVKAWERVEKENRDYWKEEDLSFNLADVREESVSKSNASSVRNLSKNNFKKDCIFFLTTAWVLASILLIASH